MSVEEFAEAAAKAIHTAYHPTDTCDFNVCGFSCEGDARRALAAVLPVHERQVRERDAREIEEVIDYDVKTDFDRGMAYAVEILRGAKEPSAENRPIGRREIEQRVREQVAKDIEEAVTRLQRPKVGRGEFLNDVAWAALIARGEL